MLPYSLGNVIMFLFTSFIFFFVSVFFLLSTQEIYAANIGVNTFLDELNANGNCSLRESFQSANTDTAVDACLAGSGTDTIILSAGTYTLSLIGAGEDANATGDLDINSNLTISGAGATSTTIDGGAIDRVFEVHLGTTVQVNGVTIQNGSIAGFGGGIFNRGTMTIDQSSIDDNETTGTNLSGGGGGIFNQGTMTITKSTVSNNTSQGRGAGIYNLDLTLNITNSTISTNTGLNGAGIFNRFGTVQLSNSTVANNTATDNGGGIWNFGGIMRLAKTIVGNNMAPTASDDCAGIITSLGYNLASDASCGFSSTGDLNSTNPQLGVLANNGGSTQTHALLPGSPAVDVVPLCTVATDQRGISRPQGPVCDIGAFELEPTLPSECDGNINDYNLIQGTNGNDNLIGTSSKDLIFGYGGKDKIIGKSADDCLVGGSGDDNIDGGSGNDVLLGGDDIDKLKGGSGDDRLEGGGGNDDMDGGSGSDFIDGQAGASDKANGGTGTDTCTAETETNCEI